MRAFSVPVVLVLLMVVHRSQSGHLPFTVCTACATIFKQMGCLDEEKPLCRFLAVKFTTTFGDQRLCDNFICGGGYGQVDTNSCKQASQCFITKWRPQGMCGGTGNICCAP